MSLCGLGIKGKIVIDSLEVCEHFVHKLLPCNLCEMQRRIDVLADMYKSLSVRVEAQHEFKLRQIDDNRKISRRVDELEEINSRYDELHEEWWNRIEKLESKFAEFMQKSTLNTHELSKSMPGELKPMGNKTPYRCPICEGKGKVHLKEPLISRDSIVYSTPCMSCQETGIIWG